MSPRLAMVAHDTKKAEMVDWAKAQGSGRTGCRLEGTGTTGARVVEGAGLPVTLLKSGPLSVLPHDGDVKVMLRISTLNHTIMACNRATAECVLHASSATDLGQLKRMV